jgi:hypothetical protein
MEKKGAGGSGRGVEGGARHEEGGRYLRRKSCTHEETRKRGMRKMSRGKDEERGKRKID